MPYPYNNDLGKNPPPSSVTYNKAPGYTNFPIHGGPKKKPPEWASKPVSQEEMLNTLYGANPHTLKFPGVLPLATTKDYPGSHPANKWGKPDPTMIPDDKSDKLAKEAQELIEQMSKGIISKQEAYLKVWGNPSPVWEDTPSLPSPIDPYDELLKKLYGGKVVGDFTNSKPAPQFLGKMMDLYDPISHAHEIRTVVKIEGIGVGDIKFGVSQKLSDMAALGMNSEMLESVLDETFAKMKKEIMKKVIEKAGENGS